MEEKDRERIEAIIGQMSCPKNFHCAETGFKDLCRARDFGLDEYLECLELHPEHCNFAIPFGNSYLCQCPLRVYLAKRVVREE